MDVVSKNIDSKVCPQCQARFPKPKWLSYGSKRWVERIFCTNCCSAIARMEKRPLVKETTTGIPMGARGIDLTGKVFGKLTILHLHSRSRNGQIRWLCKCECGVEKDILGLHLNSGKIVSCGKHVKRSKDRKDWKGYEEISGQFWHRILRGANGEKGRRLIPLTITIREIWEIYIKQERRCALSGLPIAFSIKWDTKGTASLDRIDSGKGYSKDNVQWVHKDINKIKNSFDQKYFIELCKTVAKNNS